MQKVGKLGSYCLVDLVHMIMSAILISAVIKINARDYSILVSAETTKIARLGTDVNLTHIKLTKYQEMYASK